jgi:hypothetical protein
MIFVRHNQNRSITALFNRFGSMYEFMVFGFVLLKTDLFTPMRFKRSLFAARICLFRYYPAFSLTCPPARKPP